MRMPCAQSAVTHPRMPQRFRCTGCSTLTHPQTSPSCRAHPPWKHAHTPRRACPPRETRTRSVGKTAFGRPFSLQRKTNVVCFSTLIVREKRMKRGDRPTLCADQEVLKGAVVVRTGVRKTTLTRNRWGASAQSPLLR